MKTRILKIGSNEKIAEKIFEMTFKCSSDESTQIAPGQFINIRLDQVYLRRPISVCYVGESEIRIVYKVVGEGTKIMSRCARGDGLDVLLPLGKGFNMKRPEKRPLLIGGGMGAAPLYGLCEKLQAMGKKPRAALGFTSGKEAFYIENFKRAGVPVQVATVDGSLGKTGVVTDIIAGLDYDCFYACGPEAMLKAVHREIPEDIYGEMSFEARLGCGFGACMGCSCKTLIGSKRICKEGPVMNRGEVCW
ncbi:MAG: dihydroorotate dehydrogenase electron transfer subunit [Clostridiales bacterium]|nr:dihydroorotate dehydrogenase electron transfer subunit [Clostridiales bacterium]